MPAIQVAVYHRTRETSHSIVRTEDIRYIRELRDTTVPFPLVEIHFADGQEVTACGNIAFFSTLLTAAIADFGVPSASKEEFQQMLDQEAKAQTPPPPAEPVNPAPQTSEVS